MAIITSPENQRKLPLIKAANRRLALAEDLTDEQARALAREGKVVVWIDGGLHATEVLGAQQLIETIYQLEHASRSPRRCASSTTSSSCCTLVNPDGMELVVELVHARGGREEAHAPTACRGSTRSTSATTTTATST